jgi:MinD superfamily P-loop ATPase
VFISLFGGLVVALPVMTKKRTQCSYLCPLGAVNTLSNKINPFIVTVDPGKCTKCYKCVTACPLFAISRQDIDAGKISVFCSKCGKCIDTCPGNALSYGIKGVPQGSMKNFPANLFLFVSFLFMTVFSSGAIVNSLQKILSHIL